MKYIFNIPFILLLSLAIGENSLADDPTDAGIGIPISAIELNTNEFLHISNDHGLNKGRDFGIVRQRANGSWSRKTAAGQLNKFCSENGQLPDCAVYGDALEYGAPILAPVDGVIAGCWRNHPNNPLPGSPHPERCCGGILSSDGTECVLGACDSKDCAARIADCPPEICPPNTANTCRITRSGNHMVILTADSHTVIVAHMIPGSIPEQLCPFDNKFMIDSRTRPCEDCGSPIESVVPVHLRPTVRRGDYIGRVGSSGASSNAHFHSHINTVLENPEGYLEKQNTVAYRARNAWQRPRNDEDGWQKMDGDILPLQGSDMVMRPSPFLRRHEASGEETTQVEVISSSVTIERTAGNRMRLTSWGIEGDGSISKQDETVTENGLTDLAVARPGNARNVVTAIKASNDELKLSFWQVRQDGTIALFDDDTSAGIIDDVSLAAYPVGRGVVSAVKANNGSLKLIAWELDGNNEIVRRGSITGGVIRAVDVAAISKGRGPDENGVSPFRGVVTAAKNNSGNLRLAAWRFDQKSGEFEKADGIGLGEVTGQLAIASVAPDSTREGIVVAARSTEGMRLISLTVDSDGTMTKAWETRLGEAKEINLSAVSEGRFMTALQDGSGHLRIIGWWLGPRGKIIRLGEEQAGKVSSVASAVTRRNNGEKVLALTAVRANNGNLKLISYDTNL